MSTTLQKKKNLKLLTADYGSRTCFVDQWNQLVCLFFTTMCKVVSFDNITLIVRKTMYLKENNINICGKRMNTFYVVQKFGEHLSILILSQVEDAL